MRSVLKSLVVVVGLLAVPALAKGPPTHQCNKGGTIVAVKKKACAAEGGKWEPIPVKAVPPKSASK